MNNPVDLVAVIGTCGPERHRLAMNLAAQAERWFIPAARLAMVPDPLEELVYLARWATPPEQIFAELPEAVTVTDAIGALTASDSPVCLREVLCVVDASHLLSDLARDDYFPIAPAYREPREFMARAMLTVNQIEFASTIVFVNWEPLSTPDLSMLMSLASHLAPDARLQLQGVATGQPLVSVTDARYSAELDRPGWVRLLNDELAPHMTDSRVSAFRYQRVGSFHPERLQHVLDEQIEPGQFGQLLRSCGFCSLASRPEHLAQWNHVGSMIQFDPIVAPASDIEGWAPGIESDADFELNQDVERGLENAPDDFAADVPDTSRAELTHHLAAEVPGQDLALIGMDLDQGALAAALDTALLTDEEFTAGPDAWRNFADPFPEWHVSTRDRKQ